MAFSVIFKKQLLSSCRCTRTYLECISAFNEYNGSHSKCYTSGSVCSVHESLIRISVQKIQIRAPLNEQKYLECTKFNSFFQCCGSRSGIRCLFDPWILNMFFPDSGSRIPNPYIESLMTIFWVKSSIILCKLAQIFVFTSSKLI